MRKSKRILLKFRAQLTERGTMRNLSLLALFFVSCSAFTPAPIGPRGIASLRQEGSVSIDLRLDRSVVFANGADVIKLVVQFKNEQGSTIEMDPTQIKILTDVPSELGKILYADGSYTVSIKPRVASPDFKAAVIWKNRFSKTIAIKTTLRPRTDLIKSRQVSVSNMSYVSGLEYTRGLNFPEGQYEGFSIHNRGKNAIVSAQHAMRYFDFDFEEQATQNISLRVQDAPNGTSSHAMLTHFMFFPRKNLPYASINDKGDIKVTLPTGEPMVFSKNGEVIDGVFEEGPVDVGPDRFKRTYADLKYQGKGIILRANARGQLPQQGQFETSKIDLEYGIKFSTDVLIINGSTGERCRRPKADFWKPGDHSPVLFNFPTDKEFNTYLEAKCGFGIPDLESEKAPLDHSAKVVEKIWSGCAKSSDLKQCLDNELKEIEDKILHTKVKFEITLRIIHEKKQEEALIKTVVQKQVADIHDILLKDASWTEMGCMPKALSLVKSSALKFHHVENLIKADLEKVCAGILKEMSQLGASEIASLKPKLEADFSWVTLSSKNRLVSDCTKKAQSLINSTFRFYEAPSVYQTSLTTLCAGIESSAAYKAWIKTQGAGVEEVIFVQLLEDLELRAGQKAQSCIKDFPMDTPLNKIKFKTQRESCYNDGWAAVESQALAALRKDPMVLKVGLSLDNIEARLSPERRRIQLKVFKKYFI